MMSGIKTGTFAALAASALILTEHFFRVESTSAGRYEVYGETALLLGCILAGILRGEDSPRRKLFRGLLGSLVASLLFTGFTLLYLKSINPGYIDVVIARERDLLVAAGAPDDIIVQKVNGMRLSFGVGAQVISAFFRSLIGGSVVSSIAYVIRAGMEGVSQRRLPASGR